MNLTLADGVIIRLTDPPVPICRYGSWRLMQAGVGVAAVLTYLLMYVGMPDTSHPGTRGIDKEFGGKFKWVWLNPFKCLWYLRSPNLLALVSFSLVTQIVLGAVCDADFLIRWLLDVRWRYDYIFSIWCEPSSRISRRFNHDPRHSDHSPPPPNFNHFRTFFPPRSVTFDPHTGFG